MTNWIKKEDARNRLDSLFEFALVLVGVLGAALFQYMTSLPMNQDLFFEDIILNYTLGLTTFPFVFLILIWILKEVLLIWGNSLFSLRLTFLSRAIWGSLLFIYLFYVFSLIQTSDYFFLLALVLGIIPVMLIAYGYKKASIDPEEVEYFKGSRWKKELAFFIIFSFVIMFAFSFGFLYSLFLLY